MADSTPTANSLLTEHLRWTPLSLIDDIINSINELLYRAVGAVETGLLSAPPATLGFAHDSIPDTDGDGNELPPPAAKAEIENGVHALETLLEATVDRNFDKLEIYLLRSVLAIPDDVAPWLRLGHHAGLDFAPAEDAPTQESIDLQRRRLRQTEALHAALLRESAQNDALIAKLRAILPSATTSSSDASATSPFSFLASSADLSTTSSFASSQLPALRALLATLTPFLSSPPSSAPQTDARSARVDYAESRVRRHLEGSRGLALDAAGAPLDDGGEWQGSGRRVADEEVAALEGVLGLLAANGSSEQVPGDQQER
ncbi:MAG: hypothetical protein M1832_003742 [Thelocarpon impressellum]|nr:MAG: hypothetical protein M1832_003742 [Thelocarpon impressellum]